ncbi:uracil-DNA glycosylase [Delitschia confertaspora ATCC 74209]|uniref:Uracil-DNA glycosylase n=1 Tax=Delitschia confertaspora ATCC 74209 TaxID=1513339 RepID=A0A9P4MTV5_9PLEO|nr:uracil-DNA glycosylase [Delitschia confertaspora ATCC 74209]
MAIKRKATDAVPDAKKVKPNASITSFFKPPTTPAAKATPSSEVKFNKEAWVEELTEEQKDLLQLEIDTLHDSWLPHLKGVLLSPKFLELKRFLKSELASGKTIYPPMKDVYSWSRHTPLDTVKAVILGQDPYHGPNQAHGLAFSVRPPTPAPPSLMNMYKALANDYPDFKKPPNRGGLLTPWADRGVLMINTSLTVRRGDAGSHSGKGWELLTQKVIDTVAKVRNHGVVFLAWGKPAGERVANVNAEKHLILKSVHPSPLSAHRGFFDCHHFMKTNEWLVLRYGKGSEIDWNLDVDPEKAGV